MPCTSTSRPLAGRDDVHVDLGARVLLVRRGRARARRRRCRPRSPRGPRGAARARAIAAPREPRERERERGVGADDRGGARAAVGLEHVAVDRRSVRSPSASSSITARRLRPIRRWISCVRPDGCPRAASRSARRSVEPGQQRVLGRHPALPRARAGSAARYSSAQTVQSTLVRPSSQSTEASGFSVKSRVSVSAELSGAARRGARPSLRRTQRPPPAGRARRRRRRRARVEAAGRTPRPRGASPSAMRSRSAGAASARLLARVRDEADLDQRRRHLHAHQHHEGRLLHAARLGAVAARRARSSASRANSCDSTQVLGRDHVAEDRDERVVRRLRRRVASREGLVLALRRGCATPSSLASSETKKVSMPRAARASARVGVDRDEEIGARVVRDRGALVERRRSGRSSRVSTTLQRRAPRAARRGAARRRA